MNATTPFHRRVRPALPEPAMSRDDHYTWCPSVVRHADGRYSMFASSWSRRLPFMARYPLCSAVIRGEADTPAGPFTFREVVLGDRGEGFWDGRVTHNPQVHRVGDRLAHRDAALARSILANPPDGPHQLYVSPIPTHELHHTTFVAERFEAWLDAAGQEPWCTFVGFPGPHHPFSPTPDILAQFDGWADPGPADPEGALLNASEPHRAVRDLPPANRHAGRAARAHRRRPAAHGRHDPSDRPGGGSDA